MTILEFCLLGFGCIGWFAALYATYFWGRTLGVANEACELTKKAIDLNEKMLKKLNEK